MWGSRHADRFGAARRAWRSRTSSDRPCWQGRRAASGRPGSPAGRPRRGRRAARQRGTRQRWYWGGASQLVGWETRGTAFEEDALVGRGRAAVDQLDEHHIKAGAVLVGDIDTVGWSG